jgi:hypothetical protein
MAMQQPVPGGDEEAASALLSWLTEQGYTVEGDDRAPDGAGNRTIHLLRGTCQATLARDRGQWYVELGPADAAGFDINLWEAYLRDQPPEIEPTSFEDDARTLHNLLHEVERSLVLDSEALDRLAALQTWRQEARWSQ